MDYCCIIANTSYLPPPLIHFNYSVTPYKARAQTHCYVLIFYQDQRLNEPLPSNPDRYHG